MKSFHVDCFAIRQRKRFNDVASVVYLHSFCVEDRRDRGQKRTHIFVLFVNHYFVCHIFSGSYIMVGVSDNIIVSSINAWFRWFLDIVVAPELPRYCFRIG